MKLLAGDILLFHGGKDLISKLICWGTGSIYHHTGVVISPGSHLMIEAQAGTRVHTVDIRKLNYRHYDVYRVKEEYTFEIDDVISFLANKLGARYDYTGVLYLGLLKLLRLKGKANRLQREKDWFCSELVCAAFRAGALDIVPQLCITSIASPQDIAESEVVEFVV